LESYENQGELTNEAKIKLELQKDNIFFPRDKLVPLFLAYAVLLVLSFIIGNPHYPSIIGIQRYLGYNLAVQHFFG
jgi:hypothetical protein